MFRPKIVEKAEKLAHSAEGAKAKGVCDLLQDMAAEIADLKKQVKTLKSK